ncbi:PSD1 and planctomycete cytochrome C domain-containing protein [Tundrisphaera lichenicola]|uniref:PSD1 and planctomycete cytochrome C domain-containing protein n=1 Tax=Tundrisphaera lichenicola TaxID=2029860 RepID=UPI003EBACA21
MACDSSGRGDRAPSKIPAFVLILAGWLSGSAPAQDDGEFFEKKIRPILANHCQRCHSSARKQNGGLALDSKAGWERGGDSGPSIRPGNVEESLLLQAVRWTDEALRMPPEEAGGKLSDGQIADLEAWVKRGAFDPRTDTGPGPRPATWAEVFEERRNWWSLKPVRKPPVPEVDQGDRPGRAVDHFLDRRMASEGVSPAAAASPRTLIRRLSLVLTGLPPTAEESAAFEESARRDPGGAYEALVDRLLASPRFGERFARHWLDVVRYSETHGNEWNYDVPHAWRYRDYVIRAFNEDLPYDQFAREQIAGDLLPEPRWNARGRFNESLIGTAFYRFGEVNHDSCVDFGVIGYDIVDNQLDTLTKTFQATTVACARCHDHKKDAVSTRDYYGLLGILRSSRSVQHTLDSPEINREAIADLNRIKAEIRAELASLWTGEVNSIDGGKLVDRLGPPGEKPPPISSPSHAWDAMARASSSEADDLCGTWQKLVEDHATEQAARSEFNRTKFQPVADFRGRMEPGWTTSGMGLRGGPNPGVDITLAHEGEAAIQSILPSGLFTFGVSRKLNGALRSPTLPRGGGKLSFQVIGGGHSLSRVVFNNCQLNYTNQHSIHHDDWTWVTVDFPDRSAELLPYAELLTFWDSPKYPDPLGTLGKDTDNQRQPWDFHTRDPRSWWGLRQVVAHDGPEPPKEDLAHLDRLESGDPPASLEELGSRYSGIAREVVAAFAEGRTTDDDVKWLNWLLDRGLISNKADASPRLASLIASYRKIEEHDLSPPTTIPGMADEREPFDQPILIRGEYTRPGDPTPRRYLQAIEPEGTTLPLPGSGRGFVADQIASPTNPLTARVMVNRVWQWVFGRGIVRTPDDFGHLGEPPTHPELLDYLAAEFVEDGWSVKRLVRELVLSRAFRAAANPAEGTRERDPDNILLSHYPARRAEAEVIRDSLLAVSGRLDGKLYGPSVHPYRDKEDTEKRLFAGPLDGDGRRSLYIKFQLMESPRFLSVFNLPGGKVTQGRRDASNVPAQSLALLNDPLVWNLADHWAGNLQDRGRTIEDRVDLMFRDALGRPASDLERGRFAEAVRAFAELRGVSDADLMVSRPVWQDAAHAIFNLKEFIFIP